MGGRLLLGYGVGAFTVISPLFISETSPTVVAGSMGAINQFMVTAGIMIADILGFIIPYKYIKGKGDKDINNEIYSTKIWRLIFIIPLILAVLQTILVLFVFRNDTPKYYKQKRMKDAVERVDALIYAEKDSELNRSYLEDNGNDKGNQSVPLKAHCSEKYRKAFMIGCILACFQQLTGINAVIFYSNDIFIGDKKGYDSEQAAKIGTMLVGVVNWAAAMIAIPLLIRFGRKTLLIIGQIGMGISLLILGVLAIKNEETAIKVFTLFFLFYFEIGIGPILWLYAAEIMTETGMAAASLITWIITIIFGLFTNKLFKLLHPEGMYFVFTGVDIVGLLFILFVIKETKGLSKDALTYLYTSRKYNKLEDGDNEYLKTNDH